uniref:Uncharacterized protein n=1 Tax=Arundo donax TaxID=35708 RepID=A0A0A9ADP7_ARUDO
MKLHSIVRPARVSDAHDNLAAICLTSIACVG